MLLILIFTTILVIAIVHQHFARKKLPRGPTPLPLIGNLHQFAWRAWKLGGIVPAYHTFEKEFGKVFTIWMGPMVTVYISDYDIAHESHIKRANIFSERYASGMMNYIREGRGITGSNGDFWQEHRRFALQTLRGFGMGRNIMEERIMEEYRYRYSDKAEMKRNQLSRFTDYSKTNMKNGAIEVHAGTFFDLLVGSIINQLLVSERFEQDDKEFEKLKTSLALALENFSMIDFFVPTFILESPLMRWRQKKIFAPFDFVLEVSKRNIAKRVAQIKNGEHVIEENGNDFVDAYLVKIEKDERDGMASTFNHETLAIDLFDLWLAGQETTSTTLTWACACLLNNPEVVKKLRAELLKVTGGNRHVSLIDRVETHYLNAVINEVQRIASILNTNLFRRVQQDTVIDGQPIRAGTALTTQISMMHTNEQVFKNPAIFDPDRFLENSSLEKKLIPFGIGKRACLGESLARSELYLILGNLVLEYDLQPMGPVPKIETITPNGLLRRSPSYNIRFVPINN